MQKFHADFAPPKTALFLLANLEKTGKKAYT